jgi:protein-tyrosine-phosphatase
MKLDPEAADRTYSLADFGEKEPTEEVIPDPFGASSEAYEECLRRIELHLGRVVPYILAELREREVGAK